MGKKVSAVDAIVIISGLAAQVMERPRNCSRRLRAMPAGQRPFRLQIDNRLPMMAMNRNLPILKGGRHAPRTRITETVLPGADPP